jgi:hypothetical protein
MLNTNSIVFSFPQPQAVAVLPVLCSSNAQAAAAGPRSACFVHVKTGCSVHATVNACKMRTLSTLLVVWFSLAGMPSCRIMVTLLQRQAMLQHRHGPSTTGEVSCGNLVDMPDGYTLTCCRLMPGLKQVLLEAPEAQGGPGKPNASCQVMGFCTGTALLSSCDISSNCNRKNHHSVRVSDQATHRLLNNIVGLYLP